METIRIGTPLLDATNPEHGVMPHRCLVCGTTEPHRLHTLGLSHGDLARAGFPGVAPVICLADYQKAMESLGEPRVVGHARYCTRCGAHGPVAVWPLQSDAAASIFACRPCFLAAIRALIANRLQETTQ